MLTLVAATDPLNSWTPLATRQRSAEDPKWVAVPGAPFTLRQAHRLREAGKILQALRFDGGIETVVVKRAVANQCIANTAACLNGSSPT